MEQHAVRLRLVLTQGALAALAAGLVSACYAVRASSGGAQVEEPERRTYDTAAVRLPEGYSIDLVARDLTFPTGVAFSSEGTPFVVEAGYSYGEVWTVPRLLRVSPDGSTQVICQGAEMGGPWTGVAFQDDHWIVVDGGTLGGGRVLRISMEGEITELVRDLPSFGDHHANGPAVGPDGGIYFGLGTATNSGIVGVDNAGFGWLGREPAFHDVPGQDILLAGHNVETRDVLTGSGTAETGAFSAFGQPTRKGQLVKGRVPCSGSVLKRAGEGGELELVAWGFRNPFGLAFAPDGALYATDNGYDDRGSRPVWGSGDLLWRVERGLWYGWPDFSGDRPLTEPQFQPPGGERVRFLLAEHPNQPPPPVAVLEVHGSANGLDFSHDDRFGHVGDAFIALFGDQTPSTGKVLAPVGFKVVRVDVTTGIVHEFAANSGEVVEPGSRAWGAGFERPIAVRFDPEGTSLYVVDFGILSEDEDGSHPIEGSGCLWRIHRREGR